MDQDSNVRELGLDSIRIDAALQPRVQVDQEVVAEYAEAMEAGDAFPAIIVFYDGTFFWLADGWHRVEAARSVRDKRTLLAEVREGTRRDALLFSVGANAEHGLRRTALDKRKSVARLLQDPEWAAWSDREIARACRVAHSYVGMLRRELEPSGLESRQRTFERGGTVATMNTGPIAAANEARAAAPESVHTESKDGGVDGWTPEYGQDSESYAPIWRLEQAVNKYLDVRHGIRAAADENYAARLATVESLVNIHWDLVCREINQFIEQKWRKNDLLQALRNVRDQLRQQIARKQRGEGPPQGEPATEVVPAATPPREPSAWAPELAPEKHEQHEPIPDDVVLTVSISGTRDPERRRASVSVKTFKHGRKMIDRYFGGPSVSMAKLYVEINAMLGQVLEPEVLALVGPPSEPCGVETVETAKPYPQVGQFVVGMRVQCGSRTGQVTECVASGRVVEFRGDDGKMYRYPGFMVQAIEEEPAA